MKKVAFILPYFGEFPNYFQIFLNSCSANEDFDWLIFTDNKKEYNASSNIKFIHMDFLTLKDIIQRKFDFTIALQNPRKLCDYKPAYGYIFEKYLKGYDYWGHCDCDIVFGNLKKFLAPLLDKEKEYDKIFTLGHLILYKNTVTNNRTFLSKWRGRYLFEESYKTNEITTFDETYGNDENVNSIFLAQGKKVFQEDLSYNVDTKTNDFRQVVYDANKKEYFRMPKLRHGICIWEQGSLRMYYKNASGLAIKELMYIHLQQRKMKVDVQNQFCVAIVPNLFYSVKHIPNNAKSLYRMKQGNHSFHAIRNWLKWKKHGLQKKIRGL